ncbi:hypothetical protein LZ32DRAFT_414990 [Colletotrichum eremochloae]|nr:hypothetical protein LZ32DRAFT_414990 [Colletotrichum eremochloae]
MQRKVVWHRHQSDKLRETWISCTSGHCSSAACFSPQQSNLALSFFHTLPSECRSQLVGGPHEEQG